MSRFCKNFRKVNKTAQGKSDSKAEGFLAKKTQKSKKI